jgi:hypothetical protein
MTLAACNGQKPSTPAAAGTPVAGETSAKPAPPAPSDSAPVATPALAVSPCESAANPKRCFSSQPFTVSIVNVDHTLATYHVIRLNIEVRNSGNTPVILGYQWGTGKATDNLGNGYAVKAVPTGIPTDYGAKTDARLALQPGEAHMTTFEVMGYRTPQDPSSFNYDMTIDELGSEKPNPVLREHAVYFRDLTPAMPGGK